MNDTTKVCAATVVCVAMLIGFPVGCTVRANQQVVEAIRAGAKPITAACAIKGDTSHELCTAVLAEAGR